MKKTERKYITLLVLLTIVVVSIKIFQPTPVDWTESYSAAEKKPFGAYILNNLLPITFEEVEILTNNSPIFESELDVSSRNWVFINQVFALDEFENEILHEKVTAGDHIFISAREIGGAFADSLNLRVSQSFPSIDPSATSLDSLVSNPVNFSNENIRNQNAWAFPIELTQAYFTKFDTTRTEILGYSDSDQVNFIKVSYGSGAYYIHSNPFLFTNYFLRNVEKYDYAFKALSYLPKQTTYWDEYYKIDRLVFSSPIQFIISNDNLKWAWFTGLFGIIAYLIFNSRRTQRIIPVINPPSNTSIDFAQTIANLYINNGTHKDILEKKITFLFDYIRTSLNLTTSSLDEETLKAISNRSGIEKSEIDDLFRMIELFQNKDQISETELKRITERIDRFYKQSQR